MMGITIQRYALGPLQANCYFVIRDKQLVLIDPGDSAEFILEEVSRHGYALEAIIATHGHVDHVLAVGEIQAALTQMGETTPPCSISEADLFLVKRLNATAKHFYGYDPHALLPSLTTSIEDVGSTLLGTRIEVIQTPGHTPGSISLYLPQENMVFTGDTVMNNSIGRYDFSYSSRIDLFASIERLLALPEETMVLGGHGEATTVQELKQFLL